jgi:prepilin-type N-terminal cleavage/methylation domain-containing protein
MSGLNSRTARCKRSRLRLPSPGGRRCGGSRGFTLIELLVVIVIIGILASMVAGALFVAMNNAQKKRNETQKQSLKAALETYRHEYSEWPADPNSYKVWKDDNHEVIAYLLRPDGGSTKNPRRIQFINISEFLTNELGSVISPVSGDPYELIISPSNDTCEVNG